MYSIYTPEHIYTYRHTNTHVCAFVCIEYTQTHTHVRKLLLHA